jgi:hypothetical protein
MSVPGNFSPQELIGHFLWKKRKAGKRSKVLLLSKTDGTPHPKCVAKETHMVLPKSCFLFMLLSYRNYGS